jgi:hypothetical protein
LAPTSAVFSRARISQLASRNKTRGPNRFPAFCRVSIYLYLLRRALAVWRGAEEAAEKEHIPAISRKSAPQGLKPKFI